MQGNTDVTKANGRSRTVSESKRRPLLVASGICTRFVDRNRLENAT
jgi:hypothetical protein